MDWLITLADGTGCWRERGKKEGKGYIIRSFCRCFREGGSTAAARQRFLASTPAFIQRTTLAPHRAIRWNPILSKLAEQDYPAKQEKLIPSSE